MATVRLLSEIKFLINMVISPTSITLNILLLYLITYKSSHNLANFKKVLYLGCITDLMFGICNFLIEPDFTVINGIYYTFTRGVLGYLPFPIPMYMFPVTLFFIYFCLVNVIVQFIYRYLLTCWKIMLTTFQFTCLAVVGACIVTLYPMVFYIHIITRIHPDQFYISNLYGTEWEINGTIPTFGAFPTTAFPNIFFIVIGAVIVGYIIIAFCGIKVWFGIRDYDDSTSNNLIDKYQKQIFIVMAVEACIPILTLVFPIMLDLTTILTGISIPWGGKLEMILLCCVPILNPTVKLLVISCYRRWIRQMLCLPRNIQISSIPSIHGTSAIITIKP